MLATCILYMSASLCEGQHASGGGEERRGGGLPADLQATSLHSRTTHRPPEDDRPGVEVDFHDIALRDNLHARHFSLGQHLVDKVIPGDVPSAGINRIQQAHDKCYDEEGPQTLPVHLILLLAPFLLL